MRTSILLGKAVARISKARNRQGSTWPGHIALKADSKFVGNILRKNPNLNVILVAGTNGKTTTTKLLEDALVSQGKKVFRNEAGANLLNGIASTLLAHSGITGKITYDIGIFEIDENSLPLVLSELSKTQNHMSIILLNLFRDQLDRYGEVNTIAKKWLGSLKNLAESNKNRGISLITNGDDPMLRFIGENSNLHAFYFGLSQKYMKKKDAPHDVDFLYCPHCETKLDYEKRSYSHMGVFKCPKCGFKHRETATFDSLPNPMFGMYNRYNSNAAALLLQKSFGIDISGIKKALENFKPAFGRQEKILHNGKHIFLLLSKNPTGFNQSIEAILEQDKNPNVLLLLNDRIPDGRDVSWIWDMDTEELAKDSKSITISGDRCFDMGLRIKYSSESNAQHAKVKIEEDLARAIDVALNQVSESETLYVLATYSAMLDTRKILKGRAIL